MAIVLNNVTSGYNISTMNANFQKIEDYINDKLLARAATGVAGEAMMARALDMNGNEILNYPIDVTNPNSLITKAYVDAGDAALQLQLNNTLRFPSPIAPSVLPVSSYYNGLQGYNNIGQPVPIFSYTATADLAIKLAGTNGASYVGGLGYVNPQMFGGVGSSSTDNTTPVLAAIAAAASTGNALDLRGGPWRVNQTLDFTNVRCIITDYTGRILVNPTTFVAAHTRKFAITFGNPDTAFGSNRASHTSVIGYLITEADNRTTELSGIYVKGALMNFGSLRARGFNGHGFRADAWWDSVVGSISVELCGNLTLHALDINPYGDTSNCLSIGRIQVEQAYHKQMNINAIRSVFGPIHSERLKILTLDDGTTGAPSGLTYQNTNILLSNSSMTQMILDAATDVSAGTVTTTPAVRLNLFESSASALYLGTSVVSATFGQGAVIDSSSFYKYYNPSYQVTMNSCRVTRTALDGYLLVGGAGFSANNCSFDTVQPDYNTTKAVFTGCTVNNNYTNTNTGVSGILFDKCSFVGNITTTGPTEVSEPTEFRNCNVAGSFVGAFQHRCIINGGYIATVALASRAYVIMNSVRGGTFNYTGDRAFVTRDCTFTTVTAWGPATFGAYRLGQRTQRIGAMSSGTAVEYVNTADGGATFTAISTLP